MALSWISGYNNINYLNQMVKSVEDTLSNDYNNLDNIPIIKIISSTSNPQNIWELKEGMYLIDGIVYVDNNTSYEVSNLFVSMTARLENGKYVLSAFIPFFKGLYEYILKSNSTEYEEHQIVILATHERMLTRYNETPYEPNGDYNPATKKYVDDKANEIITELDNIGVNKETITSLKEENRIRDIKLQALLSETSDRNISISEDTRYFDMPLSIDNGIVTINEMIGDTLVNVCDQEESVAITKSYAVENENHIALQGEYDGKARPVVYGNTLVNHNADWDGNLQTGVETSASGIEDVQVEGIKGQEVSVVVEGNTVLNHAIGKTSAVVSSIESENNGNYVDLTVANDMSSVVEIEGRTMVNVCDQKDPIAITKSYTVENSGNHIALQGEYDGKCRPVIQGNTMVNLHSKQIPEFNVNTSTNSFNITSSNNYIKIVNDNLVSDSYRYIAMGKLNIDLLKPSTTYTLVFTKFKGVHSIAFMDGNATNYISDVIPNSNIEDNKLVYSFITRNTFVKSNQVLYLTVSAGSSIDVEIENPMLFEGDLTQTPELIPTEYVEGLKSSFEDGYIPINLADDEVTSTLVSNGIDGSYIVGKSTYINKNISANNKITVLATYEGNYSKNVRLGGGVYSESIIQKGTKAYVLTKLQNPTTTYNVIQPYTENTSVLNESCNVTIHYVLEGDYISNLPIYEEVINHSGKYKVEYKVTGKNKLDINKLSYTSTNVSIANNNIVISNYYTNHTHNTLRELGFKANTNYTISRKCDVTREDGEEYVTGRITLATTNIVIRNLLEWNMDSCTVTFAEDELDYGLLFYGHPNKVVTFSDVQIEEGTVATEYEPYKEYTKTFYLNSPLLEGDTIEDVNGVATHVKRYGKVVLDGSESWILMNSFPSRIYAMSLTGVNTSIMCDKIIQRNYSTSAENYWAIFHSANYLRIQAPILTVDEFKQWLQANPTTVVYELASPIYEPISEESILCDSYVNGHLDFDSAVPIERVQFKNNPIYLKYIQDNNKYQVQFLSDNEGMLDYSFISGNNNTMISNLKVNKGLNKFNLQTRENPIGALSLIGIGFNASNIVVTEAIDADFDYFEGLKSSYECEVTEDGKYKVDVKVTGKNLFDGEYEQGYIDIKKGFIPLTSSESYTTMWIKCKSNTTYIINASYESSSYKRNRWILRNNSGQETIVGGTTGNETPKITTLNDTTEFRVYFKWEGDPTNVKDVAKTLQIEEGTVTTSYEPYFESTKTFYLNSPLLEGDKIVTKNGKVYHYHKMGKVVLDGSEDNNTTWWAMYSLEEEYSNVAGFYIGLGKNIVKDGISGISDRFKTLEKDISGILNTNEEGYVTSGNKEGGTDYHKITINKSKLSTVDVNGFKQWLQSNPTTVVYELASPYYELIDEYNNTILNIPNTVAHLTHTSAVPVNNTVFTNYKDELNVLEANTQYRLMFDCDTANIPFTVTLGGTSQEVTSKKGTHSLLITTPSELVDKNLVIDGIGRCGIDNIRIFKGDVEYDYVKGLWSGYEERKLENLGKDINYNYASSTIWSQNFSNYSFKDNHVYTIIIDAPLMNRFMLYNSSGGNALISPIYVKKYFVGKFKYYTKYNDNKIYIYCTETITDEIVSNVNTLILEGDWTDNPPTYEEVMANEGKYAVKVKLDNPNATIFGKGGRL